jgi:hypothetical protein
MKINLLITQCLLTCALARAGSVSYAMVDTDTTGPYYGTAGNTCSLISSGALIDCRSGNGVNPDIVEAVASSSAGVGSLSLEAGVGGASEARMPLQALPTTTSSICRNRFPARLPPNTSC